MSVRNLALVVVFLVACADSSSTGDATTSSPDTASTDTATSSPDTRSDSSVADGSVDTTLDASETTSETGADADVSDGETGETGETPIDLGFGLVGAVQVEVYPALPEVEQPGWNQFDVQLFDHPLPSNHELIQTIGQCSRYNRKIAECPAECGDGSVCDGNGVCVPLREQLFAGTVTWTRASDAAQVSTTPNRDEPSYAYYPSEVVDGEPWADSGEKVTVTSTGEDLPAFTAEVVGVAPMVASKTAPAFEYKLEYPEDVDMVWTPATPGAVVEVALRTGHHVAPPASLLLCRAPDAQGHVLIAKELLVGMGFCTGICLFPHPSDITRVSRTLVTTPGGPIEVVVKTRGTLQTAPP